MIYKNFIVSIILCFQINALLPLTEDRAENEQYIIEKTDGHVDSYGNQIVTVVAESD